MIVDHHAGTKAAADMRHYPANVTSPDNADRLLIKLFRNIGSPAIVALGKLSLVLLGPPQKIQQLRDAKFSNRSWRVDRHVGNLKTVFNGSLNVNVINTDIAQ